MKIIELNTEFPPSSVYDLGLFSYRVGSWTPGGGGDAAVSVSCPALARRGGGGCGATLHLSGLSQGNTGKPEMAG